MENEIKFAREDQMIFEGIQGEIGNEMEDAKRIGGYTRVKGSLEVDVDFVIRSFFHFA